MGRKGEKEMVGNKGNTGEKIHKKSPLSNIFSKLAFDVEKVFS